MATTEAKPETKDLAIRDERLHVVERELERFPESSFNRLVPSVIQEISPLMRPQVVAIRINPEKDAGDVYPTPGGGGKLSLHKLALDKIAAAVGISWTESRRSDDRKDPLYIEWQAKGTWTLPTGEKGDLVGTYDMDLHDNGSVYQDLVREQLRGNKSQQEAERSARERLTTMRRRMVPLAESGAKNRAVRSIGIKSSYSEAELRKPFVAVRFVENTDVPEVRDAVIDRMRGRVVEIYGARVPEEQAARALAAKTEQPQEGDYHEEQESTGDGLLRVSEALRAPDVSKEPAIIEEEPQPEKPPVSLERAQAIAAHVAQIRDRLSFNGKPWSEKARKEKPSVPAYGYAGGAIVNALGAKKLLSDEQQKLVRAAVFRHLFAAFTSYEELNADQVAAVIEWAKGAPVEVREFVGFLVQTDPVLADVGLALASQESWLGDSRANR